MSPVQRPTRPRYVRLPRVSAIMFGSTGAVLLALVCATAAYLTFAARIVPRWTGLLASLTALSNLLWAPVVFVGTSADTRHQLPEPPAARLVASPIPSDRARFIVSSPNGGSPHLPTSDTPNSPRPQQEL